MRQKTDGDHLTNRATGEARSTGTEGTEVRTAKTKLESRPADWPSMEAIVERDNLRKALAQVKRNKGAAGVDGMSIGALSPYLKEHWPTIRAQLARASIELAMTAAYVDQAAGRLIEPQDDTMLHVLGVKAAANDAALRITDTAMRVCGGAAFSEHLSIDRYFRDARAGHVMAPTADVLYDFYGKAVTNQPLF